MSNILRAVKGKLQTASDQNRTAAKNKCAQARQVLDQSFEANGTQRNKYAARAIELYEEAISLYSRLTEPYIAIAYICYMLDRYEDAIMMLNKAVALDPLDSKAKELLDKIKSEARQSEVSRQVSEAAQKSLSSKLKEGKKGSKGIFSMIAGIFKTKTVKKDKTPAARAAAKPSFQPPTPAARPVSQPLQPQKESKIARHDFNQLLNKARQEARKNQP